MHLKIKEINIQKEMPIINYIIGNYDTNLYYNPIQYWIALHYIHYEGECLIKT